MKLRNIISSFCLLLLAVSCSMDDDMLNDVDRGIMEAGEMYTAFTFDLSTRKGLETKAGTDPLREEEGKITKCYVVIANGDHIIGSHTYLENEIDQSGGEYQLATHLTIKVPASAIPSSLTAFVVAYAQDSENNDFSAETSLKALKEKVISNPLTDFVKVGEATGITGYKTSDKMSDFHNTDYCKAVQVALVMRAAAIELKEIKAKFMVGKEEMPLSVEVTSMTIDRQITNTLLDGQVENPQYYSDASMGGLDTRFYTYQETSSPVNVTINYLIEGKTPGSVTFPIKTDGKQIVEGGNLYHLYLDITNSVATLRLATLDWRYNKIEQIMEEVL